MNATMTKKTAKSDLNLIAFQDAIIVEWNDVYDRLPVRYFHFLRRRSIKTLVANGYSEPAARQIIEDAFDMADLARSARA